MAVTEFQRRICRLIAAHRLRSGESYVAGGAALTTLTASPRISRDIDLFHDSEQAVVLTWEADRQLLESHGYVLTPRRQLPAFIEAEVALAGERVTLQWARDSAYRFFPLMEHEDFGLTLHPVDLALNKTLALVGRLEARDWIDLMHCHRTIQHLGYLAWAACGKDPGLSPAFILAQAGRSARYSQREVDELDFAGPSPDAAVLSRAWREMLTEAHRVVDLLPPERVGLCVLDADGRLFTGGLAELQDSMRRGTLRFHEGTLRGSLPRLVE